MQANPTIEVGRRVRYHLPYGDSPQGVIVAVHGALQGRKPAPGVMHVIRPDDATFDLVTFDGRRFDNKREHDVGRPGIGCVDLLDRVHGPALLAKAHALHAERAADEARARAEAPHRIAAQQAAMVMPAVTPLFFWNGIKDAKGAPLQRAWYSPGAAGGCPEQTFTIYAREYDRFSAQVRACFDVENDTDVMTDYFAKDWIRVCPTHPLYAQVRAAYEAQDAHRTARAAKRAGGGQ